MGGAPQGMQGGPQGMQQQQRQQQMQQQQQNRLFNHGGMGPGDSKRPRRY